MSLTMGRPVGDLVSPDRLAGVGFGGLIMELNKIKKVLNKLYKEESKGGRLAKKIKEGAKNE